MIRPHRSESKAGDREQCLCRAKISYFGGFREDCAGIGEEFTSRTEVYRTKGSIVACFELPCATNSLPAAQIFRKLHVRQCIAGLTGNCSGSEAEIISRIAASIASSQAVAD